MWYSIDGLTLLYKQQIHLANVFKNERIETSLSVNGSVLPNKFGLMGHY